MLCASVAAASKAQFGYLNSLKDLTLSLSNKNMKIYFEELQNLAQYLHKPELLETGFSEYQGYDLITVPTILVDNPKTLVGMGDTISSLSLICAR